MPKNLKLAHLSFFLSLMLVIRGFLTFLFPPEDVADALALNQELARSSVISANGPVAFSSSAAHCSCLPAYPAVPSLWGVSVQCLESLVRRTLVLKFGRRLHLLKGGPYIQRQEFIRREGRPTRVHVLRDKRALEGPPCFSHREQRLPLHACLVCFWDSERL